MSIKGNPLHRRALKIAQVHLVIAFVLFLCSIAESLYHANRIRGSGETLASPFFASIFDFLVPIAWLVRVFGAEFSFERSIPLIAFSALASALLYGYGLASLHLLAFHRNA